MSDSQNLLEIDIVRNAIEIGHRHIAEESARWFFGQIQAYVGPNGIGPKTESPAEAVFHIAFIAHQLYEQEFILLKQVVVTANGQNYRFDFVVSTNGLDKEENYHQLPLAVEIDGHAFHEKTLEQVTRRNKRDRDVQLAGFKVMHFSFSELIRNPMGCVHEVVVAAREIHNK